MGDPSDKDVFGFWEQHVQAIMMNRLDVAPPSPQLLRSLYEGVGELPVGIILLSPEETIEYANPEAHRLFIAQPGTLIGQSVRMFIPMLPKEFPQHKHQTISINCKQSDGKIRHFELSSGGGENTTSASPRLISFQEREKFQTLKEERDRLFQLAALHEMLPTILHELRNPLAAIDTMVQLLLEENMDSLGEDLHAILSEVRRMGLTLKGVSSVREDIRSEKNHAIDYTLQEVVRVMEGLAARAHITLSSDISIMPLLPLNPSVISAIVFNLINNSIAACVSGGNIHVKATLQKKETFELVVSDDGAGMSAEVLKQCRELFYTTKARGNGIGLALCSRTVQAGGGVLSIQSEEGAGTSITLKIELHRPKRTQTTTP